MAGIGEYEFIVDRKTNRVRLFGTQGKYSLVHDAETYQLWRKEAEHYYTGQGKSFLYSPVEYWIMKIMRVEGNVFVARCVKCVAPGQNYRKVIQELIEEMESLPDDNEVP